MTDFLTRLIARSSGSISVAEPVIDPIYSPRHKAASRKWYLAEETSLQSPSVTDPESDGMRSKKRGPSLLSGSEKGTKDLLPQMTLSEPSSKPSGDHLTSVISSPEIGMTPESMPAAEATIPEYDRALSAMGEESSAVGGRVDISGAEAGGLASPASKAYRDDRPTLLSGTRGIPKARLNAPKVAEDLSPSIYEAQVASHEIPEKTTLDPEGRGDTSGKIAAAMDEGGKGFLSQSIRPLQLQLQEGSQDDEDGSSIFSLGRVAEEKAPGGVRLVPIVRVNRPAPRPFDSGEDELGRRDGGGRRMGALEANSGESGSIRVTIGRIDVRAVSRPPPIEPKPPHSGRDGAPSLEEYIRKRNGGVL